MTSNTTPSPYVASQSSTYSADYSAWKAFNRSYSKETDSWDSSTSAGANSWLRIDTNTKKNIVKFNIIAKMYTGTSNGSLSAPKNFKLQGSDNGTTWNDLLSVTNQTSWGVSEKRQFSLLSNTKSYRYHQILVLANNATSYTSIGGLELYETEEIFQVPNIPLVNNQYTYIKAKNLERT